VLHKHQAGLNEATLLVYLTDTIPATELPANLYANGGWKHPTILVTVDQPSRLVIAHPEDLQLFGLALESALRIVQRRVAHFDGQPDCHRAHYGMRPPRPKDAGTLPTGLSSLRTRRDGGPRRVLTHCSHHVSVRYPCRDCHILPVEPGESLMNNKTFTKRIQESLNRTKSEARWEQLMVRLLRRFELDPDARKDAEEEYKRLAIRVADNLRTAPS
jgi:hypothetical protein